MGEVVTPRGGNEVEIKDTLVRGLIGPNGGTHENNNHFKCKHLSNKFKDRNEHIKEGIIVCN